MNMLKIRLEMRELQMRYERTESSLSDIMLRLENTQDALGIDQPDVAQVDF